ncbi:MAG: AAA family ATPase [Gammaproteobacteria bacterium]|nr:AAA family ATPase [Gammaproteobacteria bacterium]
MYAAYFGLDENPFSITPDPRYLFLGSRHSEALAHLLFGIREGNGFIQLTGEVGTGKTTLTRSLLEELPEHIDVALVLNPVQAVDEFLRNICRELDVEVAADAGNQAMIDALNQHLLASHAAGRRTVLIIDEAQNLPRDLLEQVRLLTNLETTRDKLLQILLIGQPELRATLARSDLRQLAQRITARYHLEPLDRQELEKYIVHRLDVAGATGRIFTNGALRNLWQASRGIPRLVNILCDRALLAAYSRDRRQVDARMVRIAAREALGHAPASGLGRWLLAGALAAGLATSALWLGKAHWFPATPAAPGIEQWLAEHRHLTGSEQALDVLFARWQLDFDGTEPACPQAQDAGLACLFERTGWADLVSLDRPSILALRDADGNDYQVVLLGRSGGEDSSNWRIAAGGTEHRVSQQALASVWLGEMLALWRPPPGMAAGRIVSEGAQGEEVRWLRTRLEQLGYLPVDSNSEPQRFDAELGDALRRFQRDQRLVVDGIAGARSIIRLNSLSATATGPIPRLDAAAASNTLADRRP